MNTSLFADIIAKYFRGVVGKYTEKENGENKEPKMYHTDMLTQEYSADLTWNSTQLNQTIVAADVVAMDSSLPLKKRDTLSHASGVIPKIGLKFRMGEKAISDLNIMKSKGATEAEVARKLLSSVPKAIKGIKVRIEIMFQQALSTGYAVVGGDGAADGDYNEGTGVRVDYGVKAENQFEADHGKAWSQATATPQDDLQKLFDKAEADGNSIELVMMDKKTFNNFRTSEQGKLLSAGFLKQVITDVNLLPTPSTETMLAALKDEFGCDFEIVKSSFRVQKPDGTIEKVVAWAPGMVSALPSRNIGRLVYGTLAEETNPVAGVDYQKNGSYILVSEYSVNEPSLAEFTTGQALALPVIDEAQSIYLLNTDVPE